MLLLNLKITKKRSVWTFFLVLEYNWQLFEDITSPTHTIIISITVNIQLQSTQYSTFFLPISLLQERIFLGDPEFLYIVKYM